jgi:hypothetical protein
MYRNTRWLRAIIPIALLLCSVLFFLTPTSAHAATADTGPTSQIWYFAEGRVGGGFVQWLTVGNPNNASCTVTIQYYYKRDYDTANSQKKVTFVVEKNTRHTEYVNNDLAIKQFDMNGAILSASVSTSDCPGIVAERPMYFSNFHGVSSGTDVFGATQLKADYYFAEVPTSSAGESFISVFNPNSQDVPVEVTYYGNGQIVTQTHTVHANSRDTFEPNGAGLSSQHVAVKVHANSTLGIVAERPSYYVNVSGVSGSADVMGSEDAATHWTFAAGTTTSASREVLTLANFNTDTVANVQVKLLSSTGTTAATPITVAIPTKSTIQVDINAANQFIGHTDGVALDVQSLGETPQPIVAQRQIFQTYDSGANWTAQGVSDSLGVHTDNHIYNFAEGFTSVNFAEDLALANTSGADQQITITLSNMRGETDTKTVTVGKGSQQVVSITSMVANSTVFTLSDVKAYAVSMSVQSVDGKPFAAERVMHWHAFGTQGTSAVPGYAQSVQAP